MLRHSGFFQLEARVGRHTFFYRSALFCVDLSKLQSSSCLVSGLGQFSDSSAVVFKFQCANSAVLASQPTERGRRSCLQENDPSAPLVLVPVVGLVVGAVADLESFSITI